MTMLDALFLMAVSVLPTIVSAFTPLNLTFGGTSLLILVGVATETVERIKNQEIMYTNRGFLR